MLYFIKPVETRAWHEKNTKIEKNDIEKERFRIFDFELGMFYYTKYWI